MIPLEDGGDLAQKAVDQLLAQREALDLPAMRIQRLPDFIQNTRVKPISLADRELICDQAILMIEQFYAHLPFKRVRYAIDPVQRIRLLRARLGQIDADPDFHAELLDAFADMRDVHTSYRLPPPFAGAIAFLPFFLQLYFDEKGQRHFLVTDVLPGFEHPYFRPGVEVTQWSGVPTVKAVNLLAEHIPGGNPAAKFMRGMMRMTVRSLASTLPPNEEVVFVRYQATQPSAAERILEVPWFAGTGMGTNIFQTHGTSVCEPLKDLAIVRKVLWRRNEWKQERAATSPSRPRLGKKPPAGQKSRPGSEPRASASGVSKLPDIFQFQNSAGTCDGSLGEIEPSLLRHKGKCFGYVRIKTFEGDDDEIFQEFQRILRIQQAAAPDGLIVDVRGNAGGSIPAAERLLQLMTPQTITPASFQFANTSALQSVIARLQDLSQNPLQHPNLLQQTEDSTQYFADWFQDSEEAVFSGSLLSRGRPITLAESANDTGQVYYGPVVLLIDAASYSATDTFAAGFQDHGIGDIIGVDPNTGGGGASRWLHNQELVPRLKGIVELQPALRTLPAGTSMAFAILRSARVGSNAGEPVEDVGVKCTIPYLLTKPDLVDGSRDLIVFSCRHLARKPVYLLELERPERHGAELRVTVKSANLDRLVYILDGHPQGTVGIKSKIKCRHTFSVPRTSFEGTLAHELRIDGYSLCPVKGQHRKTLMLAASVRVKLSRG
jgi:hypothetical protein